MYLYNFKRTGRGLDEDFLTVWQAEGWEIVQFIEKGLYLVRCPQADSEAAVGAALEALEVANNSPQIL